jgi:predicted Rossmann fold flavoprotein
MNKCNYDLVVIGGGAAGFFAGVAAKEANPQARVLLLEKTAVLMAKVRISGGGRCNVTHACFDPHALTKNYPRGEKELIGPFHRFQPQDTVNWFESKGVKLKIEPDGRMFPITDQSETIIKCLFSEAEKLGVEIRLRQRIENVIRREDVFEIKAQEEVFESKQLLLATGNSSEGFTWAESFGHTIQKPVPSLFTLNIPSSPFKDLSGVSLEEVELVLPEASLSQRGPLLLTHFGLSGPAALKLSAWGARYFHEKGYQVPLCINWVPSFSQEKLIEKLMNLKTAGGERTLFSENPFHLPKSLWKRILELSGEHSDRRIRDISNRDLHALAKELHGDLYTIEGKNTHKEEFVTCGGVSLKEINFKTMESKRCPGLYFAGEILDIDGITGGFNFQSAWTTGYIAGTSIALNKVTVDHSIGIMA